MTKAELAAFKRNIDGMTPHNRAWILNRDVAKLLTALEEKDALIAELIDLAYNGFDDIDSGSSRRQHQMALEELKARAEK